MTQVAGISDFLDQAGTQFRVFDMGRRIQAISAEDFLAFEQGETPYPWPLQQQAWLGVMVWTEAAPNDLVIWFLRFPLDAKGHLTSAIRDDFVFRLLQKDEAENPQQNKLEQEDNNPYGYKPKQENMASFHAKAAKTLGQSPSRYYEHAQNYFSGKPGFDQWAFVGFQGIADMAARLDEDNNAESLVSALPQLPLQPFEALCQCLEHETIPDAIANVLSNCLDEELSKADASADYIALCLRALSGAADQPYCAQQVLKVLRSPASHHPEVLASISGRCWTTLQQAELMPGFLESLAECGEGQDFFNLVIVDLINIPGMQDTIHTAIRSEQRSEALAKRIGSLFQHFTQ